MRKIIFIILCTCFCKTGFTQNDSTMIYLRFPSIPPFSITKVSDSTKFTKEDLSKRKATIIIIFSPDCEHCQHETKELTAHIELFKKVQIIMASPLEHIHLKKFYDEYKIADYPNIIMGRDPAYFLGTFYSLHSFPGIFVYNKKGKFIKSFNGTVPIEQVAEALHQ